LLDAGTARDTDEVAAIRARLAEAGRKLEQAIDRILDAAKPEGAARR
jgi:hypothetical protein